MPKGTNQKFKLYYLSRIMLEKTDDDHMIDMSEIKTALEAYGVTADRKSLYDDLEALRVLGVDVIGEKVGRNYYYHVGGKQFEIAELKLLVDMIPERNPFTIKYEMKPAKTEDWNACERVLDKHDKMEQLLKGW